MEQPFVTAVTHSDGEARVTLTGVRDEPGVAGRIFTALAAAGVNVDVIIQNEPVGDDELADLSFTVDRSDLATATDTIEALDGVCEGVRTDERIGKVSIVGAGMRSHPGVAAKVFEVLGERGDQHRDDLHLADQDLLRHRRRPGSRRREGAARGLRPRRRRRPPRGPDRRRAPAHGQRLAAVILSEMAGDGYRVGVLGATGRGRLDDPRGARASADFPASEVVPFASERSAGTADRVERRRQLECRPLNDGDDPGARRGPLLGRRRGQLRVGAAVGRGGRGRRRQHQLLAHARRRAAGRRRRQPRGGRRATTASSPTPTARRWWR